MVISPLSMSDCAVHFLFLKSSWEKTSTNWISVLLASSENRSLPPPLSRALMILANQLFCTLNRNGGPLTFSLGISLETSSRKLIKFAITCLAVSSGLSCFGSSIRHHYRTERSANNKKLRVLSSIRPESGWWLFTCRLPLPA